MANENYWSPEAIKARTDAYNAQRGTAATPVDMVSPTASAQGAPTNEFIEMTNQLPAVQRYNEQFNVAPDQRTYLSPQEIVQVTNAQAAQLGDQRAAAMEGNIMDLFQAQDTANIFDTSNALKVTESMGVDPKTIDYGGGPVTDPNRVVDANYIPTNVAEHALPGLPAKQEIVSPSAAMRDTSPLTQIFGVPTENLEETPFAAMQAGGKGRKRGRGVS
jgi:hypothetical protein